MRLEKARTTTLKRRNMHAIYKLVGISVLAFMIPVGFATYANWSNIEPYVVASPDTSRGTLLYFARKG